MAGAGRRFLDFDFDVERQQFVNPPRRRVEDIRLVVVDAKSDQIHHDRFNNILDYFAPGDLTLWNDVGIAPSRLQGELEDTEIDMCFLLESEETPGCWEVVVLGREMPPTTGRLSLAAGRITGRLEGKLLEFDGGYWVKDEHYVGYRGLARIEQATPELHRVLSERGSLMYPWYADLQALPADQLNPVTTTRKGGVLLSEPARRFSKEMVAAIDAMGVQRASVSLWMSFSWRLAEPDQSLDDYEMNDEEFGVGQRTINEMQAARTRGNRIISIGTSGVRAVESLGEPPVPAHGRTNLFVSPGFKFRHVDSLLTNLHNPKGTHVIMAAAFARTELVMEACRQAAKAGYGFGIYGDSMLLLGPMPQ